MQEIAQATSNPLVICGSDRLDWTKLVEFTRLLPAHWASLEGFEGLRQLFLLHDIRDRARTPPRLRLNGDSVPSQAAIRVSYENDLFNLLAKTDNFQATDPRDKLFALLGMTRGLSAQVAIADYESSVERVFIDLAENVMSRSASLDITSYKAAGANGRNLPSWVPDFAKKSLFIVPAFEGEHILSALAHSGINTCIKEVGAYAPVVPTRRSINASVLPNEYFQTAHDGRRILKTYGLLIDRARIDIDQPFVSKVPAYKRHHKRYYAQSMHTRFHYRHKSTATVQTIQSSESQEGEHAAEAVFLFHVRMHEKYDWRCHSEDLQMPCSAESLQRHLTKPINIRQFLLGYLEDIVTVHVEHHYLIDELDSSDTEMLIAAIAQADDAVVYLLLSIAIKWDTYFREQLKDLGHYRWLEELSHTGTNFAFCKTMNDGEKQAFYHFWKDVLKALHSTRSPPELCDWPAGMSHELEGKGRVALCDRTMEKLRHYDLLETEGKCLGFVANGLRVKQGDNIVFFPDTKALKVLRKLQCDQSSEERFELIGDIYLHWPDVEQRLGKRGKDDEWRELSIA